MDDTPPVRPSLGDRDSSWHPALRSRNSDTVPPAGAPKSEINTLPTKPETHQNAIGHAPTESSQTGADRDFAPGALDSEWAHQPHVGTTHTISPGQQHYFQHLSGEAHASESTSLMPQEPLPLSAAPLSPSPILAPPDRPEAAYEHHADRTDADDAVDEAPTSSLLQDVQDNTSTPLHEHAVPPLSAPLVTATTPTGHHVDELLQSPPTLQSAGALGKEVSTASREALAPLDTTGPADRHQRIVHLEGPGLLSADSTAVTSASFASTTDATGSDWTPGSHINTATTAGYAASAVSNLPSASTFATNSALDSPPVDPAHHDRPDNIPERYRGMVDTSGNLAASHPEPDSALTSDSATTTHGLSASHDGTITPRSAFPSAVGSAPAVSSLSPIEPSVIENTNRQELHSATTQVSDSIASTRGSYSDLSSAHDPQSSITQPPDSAVTQATDSTASTRGSYSDLSSAPDPQSSITQPPDSAVTQATDSLASVRGSFTDLPSAVSNATSDYLTNSALSFETDYSTLLRAAHTDLPSAVSHASSSILSPDSGITQASDSTASVRGSYSDLPSGIPSAVTDASTFPGLEPPEPPSADDEDDDFAAMLAQTQQSFSNTSISEPASTAPLPNAGQDHDSKWAVLDDDDDDDDDDMMHAFSAALKAAPPASDLTPPVAPGTGPSITDRYRPSNPTPASAAHQPTSLGSNPYQPTPQFLGGLPSHPSAPQTQNLNAAAPVPGVSSSARSFVGQAKSGYASPYDLPTDIVQPRMRPMRQASQPVQAMAAPPPRSNSVLSNPAHATPMIPQQVSYPPSSGITPQNASAPPTAGFKPTSTPSFFEDLPIQPKLRVRPSGSNLAQTVHAQAAPVQSRPPTNARSSYAPPPASRTPSHQQQNLPAMSGLQQPDRVPLIPDGGPLQQRSQSPPNMPSRYSPSQPLVASPPLYAGAAPVSTSRYSPASHGASDGTTQQPPTRFASPPAAGHLHRTQSFMPKTSSPLVHRDPAHDPLASAGPYNASNIDSSSAMPLGPQRAPSRYAPGGGAVDMVAPPVRSQTQSPNQGVPAAPATSVPQISRPFSAMDETLQKAAWAAPQRYTSQPVTMSHRRKFSRDFAFHPPEGQQAFDPLERWKGHPIFRWSPNGVLVSSFPKQTPFYVAGQTAPTIKCTAGPIVIHDNRVTFPIDACNAKFPGPLGAKAKSKKKELLTWLADKITDLEAKLQQNVLDLSLPLPLKKRAEEKIILWKSVKVLVELDNVLDGKSAVAEAAQAFLLTDKAAVDLRSPVERSREEMPKYVPPAETLEELKKLLSQGKREEAVWFAVERQQWAHAMLISSTLGPAVWKQLTQEFVRSQVKGRADDCESLAALYEIFAGNHEECIDALVPPSARAGLQMINRRESLVTGQRDPLEGLEQWRDTLSLILSNRSKNDGQAIAALGRLLVSYGRIEAAHTCFVFARSYVNHGGRDDPESAFVLLGADHNGHHVELGADLDSIILTEILEFTLTLTPVAGASTTLPHLQSYKLLHAYQLAEHGLTSQAQAYCDAIVSAVKSTTKHSSYYHPAFMAAVDELSRCLSQSTHAGASSGWVSKLSSDKVSGSVWKRFNSFVAGDESDQNSSIHDGFNGTGASPFAKVTGDTPDISRTPSGTDLYTAMNSSYNTPDLGQGQAIASAQTSPSKYAPASYNGGVPAPQAGRYTPGPVNAGLQPRPAELERTSTSQYAPRQVQKVANEYAPNVMQPENRHLQRLHAGRPEVIRAASDYHIPYDYSSVQTSATVPGAGYHPIASGEQTPETEQPQSAPPSAPPTGPATFASPLESAGSYQPSESSTFSPATSNGYGGPSNYEPSPYSAHSPAGQLYSATSQEMHTPAESSYQPSSTFEPPEFQPYVPGPDDIGSDDDEGSVRQPRSADDTSPADRDNAQPAAISAQPASNRAAADRETDELFRKAAEADAAKAKAEAEAKGAKKGWIPGWLRGGGAGSPDKKQEAPSSGPIRAKLGEENAFYFDKNLNKWVNKKAGADVTPSAPTPPPPKSSTPRPGAGVMAGMGPPSRSASSYGAPGIPPSMPGSGPPSGPGSGFSTRVGTPMLGGEGSRPGTAASNADSIDDLLAGPRKGGTLKGKKRAGRYVDVMNK